MAKLAHGFNMLAISVGRIPGVTHWNKFGENTDVDGQEDIWAAGGLWVPPTAARLHNMVSSSANDTGTVVSSGTATDGSERTIIDATATFSTDGVAAGDTVICDNTMEHATVLVVDSETQLTTTSSRHGGRFGAGDTYRVVTPGSTGCSVVHVYGLNENMEEAEEFIVLNGTSNVPTLNTYWRIQRLHTDGAASRVTSNIGNITATAQTDNTVTAYMAAGKGQTQQAIFTTPRGKTGYITNFYSGIRRPTGSSNASAEVVLRESPFASVNGAGSREIHHMNLTATGNSYFTRIFEPYREIPPETDIYLRCEAVSDANTEIMGGFDIILVDPLAI